MKFEYAAGATPLDPDAVAGLIPNLTLQTELNDFEARNILEAIQWANCVRGADRDILTVTSLQG